MPFTEHNRNKRLVLLSQAITFIIILIACSLIVVVVMAILTPLASGWEVKRGISGTVTVVE